MQIYQPNNESFMATMEMIVEFDNVLQERIRCIHNDEIHHHYLVPRIQNKLITVLADAVK
jgi:hypothetical protein